MTDEQFELASAYLDGAVTDEERARVEGDSEMLALVRELRAISTAVSDAPPPSPTARDSAIAAALAAFDAAAPTEVMPATPVDVPPAPALAGVDEAAVAPADALVVPLAPRRRFRLGHAVSVAAAAVVVLAGGVALFRDDAQAPTNDATSRQSIAELPDGSPAAAVAPGPTDDGDALVVTTVSPVTVAPTTVAAVPPPAVTSGKAASDQAVTNEAADSAEAEAGGAANEPDPDDEISQAAPSQLPAPPATNTTATGRPTTGADAASAQAAGEAPTTPDAGDAASADMASIPAVAAAPSASAPGSQMAAAAPPELTSREEFADFATALAEPPDTMADDAPGSSLQEYMVEAPRELPLLDEAFDRCLVPGGEPLASDAVFVADDGTSHPIAVVIVSAEGEPPAYGGVDVVSCALVVDSAEPSLVTTTTSTTPAG